LTLKPRRGLAYESNYREGCISCGLCASICLQVFRMGEDGRTEVYVDHIPESVEGAGMEARDNCPVSVITIK